MKKPSFLQGSSSQPKYVKPPVQQEPKYAKPPVQQEPKKETPVAEPQKTDSKEELDEEAEFEINLTPEEVKMLILDEIIEDAKSYQGAMKKDEFNDFLRSLETPKNLTLTPIDPSATLLERIQLTGYSISNMSEEKLRIEIEEAALNLKA